LVKKSLVLTPDPHLESPISLDLDPNSADLDSQRWFTPHIFFIYFYLFGGSISSLFLGCLQLDKEVERDKWGMTPPTINAYYTPTKNQVKYFLKQA
jgi:membrane metallo-endopeptidase-like protein 1